ncbi:MAG: NrdH-redoxin [Candidatus Doudnabacteria bacterium]|nr:NrdH-redoxin [Candidatus Doudnabacteria bacterium]
MPNITIYTTPICSFCKMAKGFFSNHNLSYREKDVTSDDEALHEMLDKSGQMGVPVIDIDGEIVVGFDKRRLNQLLGV